MSSSIKLTNSSGKIVTITNPDTTSADVAVDLLNNAYTIATVDDFGTVPVGYTTVIVKDTDRGGIFVWSESGTANDGTVFAGSSGYWIRQYNGAVNADWNAASGDAQILNKPTLGTASAQNVSYFATAAQGAKADTALQPASTSTDNAIARFDGTSGAIQNSSVYIDDSGNVGIGVTPSAKLQSRINNDSGVTTAVMLENYIIGNPSSGNGVRLAYNLNDNGNASTTRGAIDVVNTYYGTQAKMVFSTYNSGLTPVMTLDASGNLFVGTTTFGQPDVNGVALGKEDGSLRSHHATGTASDAIHAYFTYGGLGIGSITQNGTTAVAYNTTSDHRLKENVRPANALRFNDIEFVDFEWIDGRHDCGVVAHQLQSVYPDLVIGEKDATEIRKIEISPAVEAVYETVVVTPAKEAVVDKDGNVVEDAVEEVTEDRLVSEAIEAVYEEQEFPVYQQVNYIGLIGRMGTKIQLQDKLIQDLMARVEALESK